MAKRKRKRRQISRERGVQQAVANVSKSRNLVKVKPIVADVETASADDNSEEYAYVRADLKRIAILAVGITVVLIALSFAF